MKVIGTLISRFPVCGVWRVRMELVIKNRKHLLMGMVGLVGDSVYTNLALLLAGSGSR